jgi:hypothetical protein
MKLAEILHESQKTHTIEQLLGMARIWRLETGENVMQIEKEYEYETRDNLPIGLEGRIL